MSQTKSNVTRVFVIVKICGGSLSLISDITVKLDFDILVESSIAEKEYARLVESSVPSGEGTGV